MRYYGVSVAVLVAGWGCTSGEQDGELNVGADTGADSAVTWYQDVKPIIESNCVTCHSEGRIGGFSLEDFDTVYALREQVAESVVSRSMPPWPAVPGCDDYLYDISLSESDIDTITQWVDNGALEGDANNMRTGEAPEPPVLSRVDFTLSMPMEYTPTKEPDDYRCFVIPWPEEEATYVTGVRVNPGNEQVVHHVIGFLAPPETADAIAEAESWDEEPGFECFGGPVVVEPEDAQWLGGWAPGDSDGDYPEGVGAQVLPGSFVILQVHYNTEAGGAQTDLTTVDVKVDDTVAQPAWIQPFADPTWLDGDSMAIPAGEMGVQHSFSFTAPIELTLYTSTPHMHLLGQTIRWSIQRADGTEDCLVQVDDWDFNWQRTYAYVEPKVVYAGDTLTMECTWDNPTDQDVNWGDGTDDEMCLVTTLMAL